MPTVKLTTPTNSTSDHIGPVTTYTAPGCCYKEPAVCASVEDGYRPFAAECTLTFGFAVETMPFFSSFFEITLWKNVDQEGVARVSIKLKLDLHLCAPLTWLISDQLLLKKLFDVVYFCLNKLSL